MACMAELVLCSICQNFALCVLFVFQAVDAKGAWGGGGQGDLMQEASGYLQQQVTLYLVSLMIFYVLHWSIVYYL
jgi:ABC-type methionine transport system permease subunit